MNGVQPILAAYGGYEFLVDAVLIVLSGTLAYLVYERKFAHKKTGNSSIMPASNASEVEKVRARAAAEVMKPMDFSLVGSGAVEMANRTAGEANGKKTAPAKRDAPGGLDKKNIRTRALTELKDHEAKRKDILEEIAASKKKYMKHDITYGEFKQDNKELEAAVTLIDRKIRALKQTADENK